MYQTRGGFCSRFVSEVWDVLSMFTFGLEGLAPRCFAGFGPPPRRLGVDPFSRTLPNSTKFGLRSPWGVLDVLPEFDGDRTYGSWDPCKSLGSGCRTLVFVRIIASDFSIASCRPLFDNQVLMISAPADSILSSSKVYLLFPMSARSSAYTRNCTPTGRVSRSNQSYKMFYRVGPRTEPC